jgi:hypothetical protein
MEDTNLAGRKTPGAHGRRVARGLLLTFRQTPLQILDFLPVALNQSVRVNNLLLLCVELERKRVESAHYGSKPAEHTWTPLMRRANWSVLILSLMALASGFMVHTTLMRALPDSEGCSIRVSFEFRYGTWSL